MANNGDMDASTSLDGGVLSTCWLIARAHMLSIFTYRPQIRTKAERLNRIRFGWSSDACPSSRECLILECVGFG
jgi:hypothetical protein